ncbi:MAG TPA: MraY family glycosyltransferase [Patescibacteria group bacterium]|nr:MraY family glycosyltransferase [Patescibacteria group bacterium]
MFLTLLYPFLAALIVTLALTPITIKLAKKYKLVDDPKKHKHPAIIHKKIIPRAGGLPIYIAILVGFVLFMPLDVRYIAILFAGFLVVGLGLLDDKYDLSPYFRFIGNIVCAGIVVLAGVTIPFITSPAGGILHFSGFSYEFLGLTLSFSSLLAIVWIVWIMNMLNWSKGVDGQMPGVAAVASIIIGIASIRFPVLTDSNILAAEASFIVAGAALGFLFYNFYPAKIFPGYSATILGFMIGVLSIISGVKLATAILVMGVPTADAFFTIIRRLLSRRSPFWHDKGHLHHLLLDYGMDQRSIAITYWLISILLGLFALNLSSRGKLFAIILVVVLVGAVILSLKFFRKKENV